MSGKADGDYPVDEVARAWLTKLRGDDTEPVRAEFEEWLASKAVHRDAYDRISRQMAASAILKTSVRHGTAQAGKRRRALPRRFGWGAAATAAGLLLIAIGSGGIPLPGRGLSGGGTALAAEPLVTRRGEIRTFEIGDGLRITLDTDSRGELVSGGDQPRFRLTKGRAKILLGGQADAMRVEAGAALLTMTDGELDVRLSDVGDIALALRSGSARITANGKSGLQLTPGHSVSMRGNGSRLPVGKQDNILPQNWTSGWAEYRAGSVGELVAEANRYAARPILIDDAATARLVVSGRFKLTQSDRLAERLALLFDLEIERRADAIHLSRR